MKSVRELREEALEVLDDIEDLDDDEEIMLRVGSRGVIATTAGDLRRRIAAAAEHGAFEADR